MQSGPIDELIFVDVNGTKQCLLLRGDDSSKPIVLFIHGGPSHPLMWYSRAFDNLTVQDFLVVHWDQRRAGKSFSADVPIETCTLDQFVDDGLAVLEYLIQRFCGSPITVVAHSWGTMIAANMAARRGGDIQALLMVGTCANWSRGEIDRYEDLIRKARDSGDRECFEQLITLGAPPYRVIEDATRFGELVYRLDGFAGTSRKLSEVDLAEAINRSKEYSESEIAQTVTALHETLAHLGDFLSEYVLADAVPRIDCPVHFVHGRYDRNTPLNLAKEYFHSLDAPAGKSWHEFEDCAHLPMYEDPVRFHEILRSVV